jgi:hypothetical protein
MDLYFHNLYKKGAKIQKTPSKSLLYTIQVTTFGLKLLVFPPRRLFETLVTPAAARGVLKEYI